MIDEKEVAVILGRFGQVGQGTRPRSGVSRTSRSSPLARNPVYLWIWLLEQIWMSRRSKTMVRDIIPGPGFDVQTSKSSKMAFSCFGDQESHEMTKSSMRRSRDPCPGDHFWPGFGVCPGGINAKSDPLDLSQNRSKWGPRIRISPTTRGMRIPYKRSVDLHLHT